MRWFKFLILVVLATSCDPPPEMEEEIPYAPTKQSLATQVRNHTILELREKKDLRACGIGSGMMDQIRMLAISFFYYNEVDIEQARDLLMTAGTVFLRHVNANEKIRPYLQNYPFEPKNIQIAIFLMKPDGTEPDAGQLTIISMHKGILAYNIDKPGTKQLITIYKETFDEALSKWDPTAAEAP